MFSWWFPKQARGVRRHQILHHPERHLEMPVARDSNHLATCRVPRPSLAPLRNSVREESLMALVLSLAGTERGQRC